MISVPARTQICIDAGVTALRRGFTGLSVAVHESTDGDKLTP